MPGDDSDKKDGYRGCWTEAAGFSQKDFDRPLLKDLPAQFFGPQRNRLIGQRKYFLDDISLDDLGMSRAGDSGHRNMVDLAESVVKFYFHPSMKGSYSIKKVLPAVLNSSEFIREKYSVPVYGSDAIPSLNWKQGKAWIDYEDDGRTVRNPYELLPSIAAYLNLDNDSEQVLSREDDDMQIANGGAGIVNQHNRVSVQPV